MPATLEGQLVVAISSRALFDFEEENRVFEQGDDRAYMQLQLGRLEEPARPGVAFSLVRKLLAFNDADTQRVEVVILSRNDPVSGMRVFRSAKHYGLPILRGVAFSLNPGEVMAVVGPSASGKSTLAQHIMAEAQKAGGTAAYIDVVAVTTIYEWLSPPVGLVLAAVIGGGGLTLARRWGSQQLALLVRRTLLQLAGGVVAEVAFQRG